MPSNIPLFSVSWIVLFEKAFQIKHREAGQLGQQLPSQNLGASGSDFAMWKARLAFR
jgi:hypothetical protein